MKLFLAIILKVTRGRPMIREGYAFMDVVSGEAVCYYRDRLWNRHWLATGAWALFRVERTWLS